MTETRKLRTGMVGGGPGAFIGPVHKMAAELDGRIELVAGAFFAVGGAIRARRGLVSGSIRAGRTRTTGRCWRQSGRGKTGSILW